MSIIKDVLIIIFIVMDLIYIHQLEKKVDALQSWVEFVLGVDFKDLRNAIDKFKEETD